jgi:hypothetical protein
VKTFANAFEPAQAPNSVHGHVARIEVKGERDARPLGGGSIVYPYFLILIPLVPYGHQQFSPESAVMSSSLATGNMLDDVVGVVVRDLRHAGVADQVQKYGVDLRDLGESVAAESRPYELRLTLDEGIYHRNATLYGMSFAGALLWMIGFPNTYGSAELAVTAELFDPNGRSLGKESFREKSGATEWLYRPAPQAYSPAMPRAYGEISPQLRRFVASSLVGE